MTILSVKPSLKFPWRVLATIAILNLIASPLVLPYALTLTPLDIAPNLYILALAQQIFFALIVNVPVAALGLLLANPIGLGAPFLKAWLYGESPSQPAGRTLGLAFLVGILGGVLLLLLSQVLSPLVDADLQSRGLTIPEVSIPPAWQGCLASISAGITEETLLRLFLLTLLAWLGSRIWHTPAGRPKPAVLWLANFLASLLFGALHLPLASSLMPLTPWIVVQVILLNSLVGLLFGRLYWKYGLESAMIAHFSTDIVLHVIPPLFGIGS